LPAQSVFQPWPEGELAFGIPLIIYRQITARVTNQTQFAAKNEQKKAGQN
jgi:hypothetical protein